MNVEIKATAQDNFSGAKTYRASVKRLRMFYDHPFCTVRRLTIVGRGGMTRVDGARSGSMPVSEKEVTIVFSPDEIREIALTAIEKGIIHLPGRQELLEANRALVGALRSLRIELPPEAARVG